MGSRVTSTTMTTARAAATARRTTGQPTTTSATQTSRALSTGTSLNSRSRSTAPRPPRGPPPPPVPVPNAQTRITDFRAVLASDSPDLLKSYDLSWLLHLVGDVHQPLHCASLVSHAKPDGDSGGNGVKLSGTPNNLH